MSDQLPEKPLSALDTDIMLQELTRGLISEIPMSDSSRKMLETAIHKYTDRVRLFLQGATLNRMARWNKLSRGLNLCQEIITDPDYIAKIKSDTENPDMLLKLVKLLHDLMKSEYQELKEEVSTEIQLDPQKQYGAFLSPVNAGAAELPASIQDPDALRKIRSLMTDMVNAAQGKGLPQPPNIRNRVIEVSEEEAEDE